MRAIHDHFRHLQHHLQHHHHHYHYHRHLEHNLSESKTFLDLRLNVLGNTCKRPEIAGRLDVRPNVLKFQDV